MASATKPHSRAHPLHLVDDEKLLEMEPEALHTVNDEPVPRWLHVLDSRMLYVESASPSQVLLTLHVR